MIKLAIIAAVTVTATVAQADIHLTVWDIAPDQAECISDTVYHDWATETMEVQQFYLDHHAAALLAVYAGVNSGTYDIQTVETAYGWYGCDWIQTLDLVQKVVYNGATTVLSDRGAISHDFLKN
jgi:ADP-ribosylglycohydrolase